MIQMYNVFFGILALLGGLDELESSLPTINKRKSNIGAIAPMYAGISSDAFNSSDPICHASSIMDMSVKSGHYNYPLDIFGSFKDDTEIHCQCPVSCHLQSSRIFHK